eukprot:scaffold341_cov235-Chaetoceros_neogracile.AAC.5
MNGQTENGLQQCSQKWYQSKSLSIEGYSRLNLHVQSPAKGLSSISLLYDSNQVCEAGVKPIYNSTMERQQMQKDVEMNQGRNGTKVRACSMLKPLRMSSKL